MASCGILRFICNKKFPCPIPGCYYSSDRRDNTERHTRNNHKGTQEQPLSSPQVSLEVPENFDIFARKAQGGSQGQLLAELFARKAQEDSQRQLLTEIAPVSSSLYHPASTPPQSTNSGQSGSKASPSPGSTYGSHTPKNDATQASITDTKIYIVPSSPTESTGSSTIIIGHQEGLEDKEVVTSHKRQRSSANHDADKVNYSKALRGTPQSEPPVKRSKQSTKTRGVIIGVWLESELPNDTDKHVIYGFIDIHDRLRTRIYGMNRRGEELVANAPTGAGGCWVTFERVIFDEHLRGLTSQEVKEYVKYRSKIPAGDTDKERAEADAEAVVEAKRIIAAQETMPVQNTIVHRPSRQSLNSRQQAREEMIEVPKRQHEKTRKEVTMAKAVIQEAAQQELKSNLKKLNKVWAAQQAATLSDMTKGAELHDAKFHNGIKYERKQTGTFQDKLVSPPQILTIDGEDYVEYRILTKPSVF